MAKMAKLSPLYLKKQHKEFSAFHVWAKMYELEPIKQMDQYNFLFLKYHGTAPGSISAAHLFLT
jgi:hypothetical protein